MWSLCDSGPRHRFLKRHHGPLPYHKQSHGNIYIYFQLFLLFSFISATGDSQEETEVMETDLYQENCLPSEATTGKSDSDMSEFICHATC